MRVQKFLEFFSLLKVVGFLSYAIVFSEDADIISIFTKNNFSNKNSTYVLKNKQVLLM